MQTKLPTLLCGLLLTLAGGLPMQSAAGSDAITRTLESLVSTEFLFEGGGTGIYDAMTPCPLTVYGLRAVAANPSYYGRGRVATNLNTLGIEFFPGQEIPIFGQQCPIPGPGSEPLTFGIGETFVYGPYEGVGIDQLLCIEQPRADCFPDPSSASAVLSLCFYQAADFSPSPPDGRSSLADLAGSRRILCDGYGDNAFQYYDGGPQGYCQSWFFTANGWGTDYCIILNADLVPFGDSFDQTGYVISCLQTSALVIDPTSDPPTAQRTFTSHDYLLVLDLDGDEASWNQALLQHADGVLPLPGWHDLGGHNGCPGSPFPACSDGDDNDGDGNTDYPQDLGCDSDTDSTENPNPSCSDGVDNDGDGYTDYSMDPGCSSAGDTSEYGSAACDDGLDNDGDGHIDFGPGGPGSDKDPGCTGLSDSSEREAGGAACDDGSNNDGDGNTDYPADAGCASAYGTIENPQCSDGSNNDGDSWTDYPNDGGCTSSSDNTENPNPACKDGTDNDGDGNTDHPADAGCASAYGTIENPQCSDGLNNDIDSWTDTADPGCSSASDNSESPNPACSNGLDDDVDGNTDYVAGGGDPGCSSLTDTSERGSSVCDNGLDDDGDGTTDYVVGGGDSGCSSLTDTNERGSSVCDNGSDDDGDGLADEPADPGCTGPSDSSERQAGGAACDDSLDNDGDGNTDYPADAGCASAFGTIENPQCLDGTDNDGDGNTDYPNDSGCSGPNDPSEASPTPPPPSPSPSPSPGGSPGSGSGSQPGPSYPPSSKEPDPGGYGAGPRGNPPRDQVGRTG